MSTNCIICLVCIGKLCNQIFGCYIGKLVSKWIVLFVLFWYCSLRFSLSCVHSDSIRCSFPIDDDARLPAAGAHDDGLDDNDGDNNDEGDVNDERDDWHDSWYH